MMNGYNNTHQVQSALDEYISTTLVPNSQVIHERIANNGGVASNQTSKWTITPSEGSLISRKVLIEMPITLTATSQGTAFAVRSFPLNRIVSNCVVKVNGQVFSSQPDVIVNLSQFINTDSKHRAMHHGLTCTAPDLSNLARQATFKYPSQIANDLVAGASSYYNHELTRRSYTLANSSDPDTGANSNNITIWGEVPLNALLSEDESDVLANVRELDITLTYRTDLLPSLFTEHTAANANANTAVLNDKTGNFAVALGAPFLHLTSYSPPDTVMIPPVQSFEASHYDIHQVALTVGPAVVGDAAAAQNLPTITTTVVPDYINIFMVSTNPTITNANLALNIRGVDLTINNRSGLLSGASQQQLYEVSRKNGLSPELTFNGWMGATGSYLRLKVGEDLPDMIAGAQEHFRLRGNLLLSNYSFGAAVPCTLYVVLEYKSKLTISSSSVQQKIGVDPDDVEANVRGENRGESTKFTSGRDTLTGGGFFKSFAKGFKKGFSSVIKPATQIGNVLAPLGGPKAQAAVAGLNVANQLSGGSQLGGGSNLGGGFGRKPQVMTKPNFNRPLSLREMMQK